MAQGEPLQNEANSATIRRDGKVTLSESTVDEIEAMIDHMERHLVPFLNSLRAARGKKPVIIPRG